MRAFSGHGFADHYRGDLRRKRIMNNYSNTSHSSDGVVKKVRSDVCSVCVLMCVWTKSTFSAMHVCQFLNASEPLFGTLPRPFEICLRSARLDHKIRLCSKYTRLTPKGRCPKLYKFRLHFHVLHQKWLQICTTIRFEEERKPETQTLKFCPARPRPKMSCFSK